MRRKLKRASFLAYVELCAWISGLAAVASSGLIAFAGPAVANKLVVAPTRNESTLSPNPATKVASDWEQQDFTDWSIARAGAFADAIAAATLPAPDALLRIPALGIEGAVFEGTQEWALNLGVGRIEGTAALDSVGNLGLAGHRDGIFRRLKDIGIADQIEVQTVDRTIVYRVTDLMIVDPEDVYVLDPTDTRTVTLVTCYPFYFLGNAPRRFIVKGEEIESKRI